MSVIQQFVSALLHRPATQPRGLAAAPLAPDGRTAIHPSKMRRRAADAPLSTRDVRTWYDRVPSFTDKLPWVGYNEAAQVVELEDARSCGALFEFEPAGCEARPPDHLEGLHKIVKSGLIHAIPEEEDPWVLGLYVQPEPLHGWYMKKLREYVDPRARGTRYTNAYLDLMDKHVARLERSDGYYFDDTVTKCRWRAKRLRHRGVLFRRIPPGWRPASDATPEEALNLAVERLTQSLHAAGITVRRGDLCDLQEWALRWFNPRPVVPDHDIEFLIRAMPLPNATTMPFATDLAERFVLGWPEADAEQGIWWFDGLPHTVVTVHQLLDAPSIGHFTAERERPDNTFFSMIDKLPEGTTLAMQVTILPKDRIEDHLKHIHNAAKGASTEAIQARKEVEQAFDQLVDGNRLYPTTLSFYLRGDDADDLRHREEQLNALLVSQDLQPVSREYDPVRVTAYVKGLPMNHDPDLDRDDAHWSKLTYADSVAALMPV